jgi:membrane-bound lytic murein transglycosylase A
LVSLSQSFRRISWSELPHWQDDLLCEAFAAFRRSAFHAREKPYRTGALGADFTAFLEAYEHARLAETITQLDARQFFEGHFVPYKVVPDNRQSGFVTGFYEPEAEASPHWTEQFRYPLYARPTDLFDLDDANRPAAMDPYFAFGRKSDIEIVEYFDRAAIDQGALTGRNLEIAWLADPVDVFFIHVQGAARLIMTDGSVKRVTYAAKSGHRFSGPGQKLINLGEIQEKDVTMQSIRAWFRENPSRISEILWQNRSYIFFREAPVDDPALGPVAAAKVPLTPGRSIAVDRLLHTFGTPFFIDAPTLGAFDGMPFRRLMIAQDTGSAITGAARGDLFTGSGFAAGEVAGVIRHPADFYALMPKSLTAGNL